MNAALLTAWIVSALVAGSIAGGIILDQVASRNDPNPECGTGQELNFTHTPAAPVPGQQVVFTADGPVCGREVLAWMLPDQADPVYGSRVQTAFPAPGAYSVTLLKLGGAQPVDVTRIVEVATPQPLPQSDAAANQPAPDPGYTYVFEEPKYEDVKAELNISTLPLQDTPFLWSAGGHVLHVQFDVDDDGFQMHGLVVYEDYKGMVLCERTFPAENWTYDANGHWYAEERDCATRPGGIAERVYLGICVEYDGEIIQPENWTYEGREIHGDKMDECWQESKDTPLPV